jgi:hypothetical protein
MPKRLLRAGHKALKQATSNARSVELEKRRQELLRRVTTAAIFGANPRLCRTAMALLNQHFHAAKLGQWASILASAEWVVRLLEAGISTF